MAKQEQRLTIFVSSTVYGIEELLDQVYALLRGYGYEVWMSHKGTVPVYPNQTAFESCMLAVKRCNLFLGIITPYYGSGVLEGDYSITHQELLRAIELKKPRWILAHDHVPFARSLFAKLGCKSAKARRDLLEKLGYTTEAEMKRLKNRERAVIDDFRVIDMYEAAIRHDIQVYQDRKGNWVQKFSQDQDAHLFVTAQFYRYDDVSRFLEEQLKDQREIAKRLHEE